MQLLLATRNAHKTREFALILGDRFAVSDLRDHPEISETMENGKTLRENAGLKALAASKRLPDLVFADDSGLEVDALSGAPGIFSARYAGQKVTDHDNIEKLLGELGRTGARGQQRSARFRCVIALARAGKLLATFEGTVEGIIVDSPRGSFGFGYDPIFEPNGFDQTFGELPGEIKNQISHRAEAARQLAEFIKTVRPSA